MTGFKYIKITIGLTVAVLLALTIKSTAYEQFGRPTTPYSAPKFTHSAPSEWINSEPLTLKDLRGKVVLIDFWTYGCWNCYRSIPWLNHVEKKLSPQGLQLIGVHTPEFEHEHNIDNVIEKIKEFEIQHPVMIDNDFSYWRAMKNRYWPAYYVLDKKGQIQGSFIGETHVGDRRAKAIEALIGKLLKSDTS